MLKKARAEAKAESSQRTGDDRKDFAQGIRDSSRQIWLAGLGAFSRAQAEGTKVFEALVEQGQKLESRTKRAAAETANAAAGIAAQKAKEMQQKAGGTWDKLEQVFEDRVARVLGKLGVQTQSDVERLSQRVEALSEAVNALIKAEGGRPAAATATTKSGKRSPRVGKSTGKTAAGATVEAKAGSTIPRKSAKKKPAES